TRLGIRSIAYAPNGERIAVGTFDGTLAVCDSEGRERSVWVGDGPSINALAFTPDGKFLAVATQVHGTGLRDVESGNGVIRLGLNREEVWSIAFHPQGATLAAGLKSGPVILLDVATGDERRRLEGHALGVGALTYSPDGSRLASASGDRTIRIWDPAS